MLYWVIRGIFSTPVIVEVQDNTIRILGRKLQLIDSLPVKGAEINMTLFKYLQFRTAKRSYTLVPMPGKMAADPSKTQKEYLAVGQSIGLATNKDRLIPQAMAGAGIGIETLPVAAGVGGIAANIAGSAAELAVYRRAAGDSKRFAELLSENGASITRKLGWLEALRMIGSILLFLSIMIGYTWGVTLILYYLSAPDIVGQIVVIPSTVILIMALFLIIQQRDQR